MAHRKPLGTTCRTRCRWRSQIDPELGELLVTAANTTYKIVGVEETARSFETGERMFNLVLERVAFTECAEPNAVIHGFAWDSRR